MVPDDLGANRGLPEPLRIHPPDNGDRHVLAGAGALAEPALRALDVIHIVSAVDLDPIEAFVTYDERQAAAARLAGLRTVVPGV